MKENKKNILAFTLLLTVLGFTKVYPQSWAKIPAIDSVDVTSIVQSDNALYATTPGVIFKSIDGGFVWQRTGSQPALTNTIFRLFAYKDIIYAGTTHDGVFHSEDGGDSWQRISSGLPGGVSGSIIGFAAIGDNLYVATNGNGVFVYNLQTSSRWSAYNTGLSRLGVSAISASGDFLVAGIGLYLYVRHVDDSEWTNVEIDTNLQHEFNSFLPMGQYFFAGTDHGIYRSSFDAQNWQKTDIPGFPNQDIVTFASSENRIFAGISLGYQYWIFTTDDYGTTWQIKAHEFAYLWDLYVAGGKLWAGRTDGLWYLNIDNSTGVQGPESPEPYEFKLDQNYPNPFNPTTIIRYELPASSDVELNLYNLRGQKVRTLFAGSQAPGSHEYLLQAGDLSSGVYIYEIRTNGYAERKSMLLLK